MTTSEEDDVPDDEDEVRELRERVERLEREADDRFDPRGRLRRAYAESDPEETRRRRRNKTGGDER